MRIRAADISKGRRGQRGATMIEMSFVIIFFVLILALIVDAGMLLYNYGLLTDSSAALSRRLSAMYNRSTASALTCRQLACRARHEIDEWKLAHGYSRDYIFTPWVSPSEPRYAPYPTLRVQASWKNKCVFCSFIPGGLTWNAWSIHVIEYDRTACTSGEERTC